MLRALQWTRVGMALVAATVSVSAADNGGPVYLDPASADADYALQGEYRGWQMPVGSIRSAEAIGLHVVALGGGEFEAVKFYGGLPGAGWSGRERFPLTGRRTGERVELLGDQADIVLQAGVATILSRHGQRIGELRRIERISPTLGAAPPPGAVVLFDGHGTDRWVNAKLTSDGHLQAGADTREAWNDFRLHGEFRIPYKPQARGQDRGNSGFYLQSRYEVQVLDSFGREAVEDQCGSLYKTRRPIVNMCLPPLQWQTYDIEFHAPRFDAAGRKVQDMRISVWHNGVVIHQNQPISHKTGLGQVEAPQPLPLKLQDHGNPVVYRNLWLVDLSLQRNGAAPLPIPLSGPPAAVTFYPPYPYPAPLPPQLAGGRFGPSWP